MYLDACEIAVPAGAWSLVLAGRVAVASKRGGARPSPALGRVDGIEIRALAWDKVMSRTTRRHKMSFRDGGGGGRSR